MDLLGFRSDLGVALLHVLTLESSYLGWERLANPNRDRTAPSDKALKPLTFLHQQCLELLHSFKTKEYAGEQGCLILSHVKS